MSKITRRDFLKTAGVMTLAVAAAGVLSGCEGKPTDPVAPPTANAVTFDDYTVTLKDTKLYSVKTRTVVDNEYVMDEHRIVVVQMNVKNNAAVQSAAEGAFEWAPVVENLDRCDAHADNTSDRKFVNKTGVKNLFKLAVEPTNGLVEKSVTTAQLNTTAEGVPYFFAYEITREDDKSIVKVPSFALRLHDTKNHKYEVLTATIPTEAVETTWGELKIG